MDSSMAKIIPDSILEERACKICLKYLTISPISVCTEGTNTCGRCSQTRLAPVPFILVENFAETGDNAIPLTLLGYATSQDYLFPCVNRFEGCSIVLPYSSLRQHEDTCFAEEHECFQCHFSGSGSQLIEHFKRNHKRNLLSPTTTFCVDLCKNLNHKYLYRTLKSLFIVQIRFIADLKLFKVKIQYLNSIRISNVKIKCKLQFNSRSRNNCCTNLQTESFDISSNFMKLNFRISDLKIIDFEALFVNMLIVEIKESI